jgi:hypothetical protein
VRVVLTDNETWAGRQHTVQGLEAYRRSVNPRVRVVVVSMTATGMMIADPADEGVLSMAGLDGSLPRLNTSFVRYHVRPPVRGWGPQACADRRRWNMNGSTGQPQYRSSRGPIGMPAGPGQ